MKQFWVSAIIQDPDDKRAWCCAMSDSVSSIEIAKETIEKARKNFTVLSAWVDVFDENNVKNTVLHECYVDTFGKVEKVEEESMAKENKIRNIEKEIEKALEKYDSGNVDFYRNEENPEMGYLMFHSRHNSFPISEADFDISGLTREDVEKICDGYDIGYIW